jgi:hypothetical protein
MATKKWATWHGAFWKPWDDFTDYSLGEFIPYCWNVMHRYLKIWAHGDGIRLVMDGYFYVITGPQILKFEESK